MKPAAVRTFALSLPEAEERETWGEATFRVRNKIFLMMGADGKRASVKAAREEQEALLAEDPDDLLLPGVRGRARLGGDRGGARAYRGDARAHHRGVADDGPEAHS